ncbi:MAG: hypothetical protein NXI17_23630 [Alphaproteobacteria bacterium]|nr:hypothetical protein [Alphaproteobacteria bacterium]
MKGFRTIIVNSMVAVLPLAVELLAFLDLFDWRSVLPAESAGWFILFIGLINIGLRFITTTPVGQKY